jgi:predicted phosphohydrolase
MFQETILDLPPETAPILTPNFPRVSEVVLSDDYVRVAYASDLHLDFEDINDEFFDVAADVLILAGDVVEARRVKSQMDFFQRCADNFPHVLYIPGNHEYYHGAVPKNDADLQRDLMHISNLHVLQNRTFDYKGVHFVGTTLWTDMNKGDPLIQLAVANYMNDFRIIRNSNSSFSRFLTRDAMLHHAKAKNFIEKQLEAHGTDPVVVFTHHAPHEKSIAARYITMKEANYGYYSDLSPLLLSRQVPTWWIHGHVHNLFNYHVGKTNVVCNPRGYPGERPFDVGPYQPKIITIDTPKHTVH